MVKSVLGVNHQGLRDWLIQRITAFILALATVGLVYYFWRHPNCSYLEWRMLFAPMSMKVLTLLVVLALAFHAWVGMWTVVTDYLHPAFLRFIIHVLVLLTLVSCFLWTLLIIWGF
ncbi:MAG TPA: succinate dehydrogenase, hydrophobic membrane anchor protein [Gammaproteobacteria bacterium]|nr:succinate dehydrogenase, hydrophobic membrane anchor protein [Gammaproteobacteria bacterium]